jgi:ATP-dependent protease HslVU (ClpYQ) peptidase subunit
MTMIACTMNVAAPVIIGDLLISDSVKPNKFIIPVLTEDVLQYLSSVSEFHPIRLDQKVYIIKSNVCIAFAGKVYYIKRFLEDISIFCKANTSMNAEKIEEFLDENKHDDSWKHFSFLILVVDKEDNHLRVGRFMHGDWVRVESDVFGEVFASGSGSIDFLKETKENVKIRSQFPPEDISYTLQVNIIMICKLLARERLSLDTVRQHWGAGFEMIYFDKDQFTKLDNITYIINQGAFDNNGDIGEVPVPGIILHYKYHGEILVITVIKPYRGETETTDTTYIIRSKEFGITQFIVVPMNYQGMENFNEFAKNPSFKSNHNAMGYIIETTTGHYLPASFNVGPELEVKYNHPGNLTITMFKDINDILTAEATSVFPNLK